MDAVVSCSKIGTKYDCAVEPPYNRLSFATDCVSKDFYSDYLYRAL